MDAKLGFQRILAAVDFSAHAKSAVEKAAWAAEHSCCPLVLVHVMTDVLRAMAKLPEELRNEFFAGDIEKFSRGLCQESNDRLSAMAVELRKRGIDVSFETLIGTPYTEIVHAVHQEKYNLVVVGRRGYTPWKYAAIGSTARSLVRHCPCPVWVVRNGEIGGSKNVLVPVDFSETSALALKQGAWLAENTASRLYVLHVMEPRLVPEWARKNPFLAGKSLDVPSATEANFRRLLKDFVRNNLPDSKKVKTRIASGSPAKEIRRAVKSLEAGIVVMGAIGRNGIEGVLLGNTAETVLGACDCDVYTVKPLKFASTIEAPFWPLHPQDSVPVSNASAK